MNYLNRRYLNENGLYIPRANEMKPEIKNEIRNSMYRIQQSDGKEIALIKSKIIETLQEARGRELLAYYEVFIKFDFERYPQNYKF